MRLWDDLRAIVAPVIVMCLLYGSVHRSRGTEHAPSQGVVAGVVRGRVVVDGTNGTTADAVPFARVTLVASGGATFASITTADVEGRFAFADVPAGTFTLSAMKAGFLAAEYGARRPSGLGTPIIVVAGKGPDYVISLPRGAALEGRVLGTAGGVLPGIPVRAFRAAYSTGSLVRRFVVVRGAVTDDRGQYRMSGLPAGEYLVSAGPPRDWPDEGVEATAVSPGNDNRQPSGFAGAAVGGGGLPPSLSAVGSGLSSHVTYPIEFWPSARDPLDAASIRLGPADERLGVNLVLRPVATASVRAHVGDAPGVGARDVDVTLADRRQDLFESTVFRERTATPDGRGEVRFTGVPPGAYQLWAKPQALASSEQRRYYATADILVNGADEWTRLEMRIAPKVRGRVILDDSATNRPDLTGLSFRLVPATGGASSANTPPGGQVTDAGVFAFPGVLPGRYRLGHVVTSTRVMSGWGLKTAIVAGVDALDLPIEVGERDLEIVVTLTTRLTRILGNLVEYGAPATSYTVVVFPVDEALWLPSSRRIVTTRPAVDGGYSVTGLPPGEYFTAVVTDIEQDELYDKGTLAALARSAVRVVLKEGDPVTQNLRVIQRR